MTKIEKIEQDVRKLKRNELSAFRRWFREFDSDEWDRQIEEDVLAGKLDKLAEYDFRQINKFAEDGV